MPQWLVVALLGLASTGLLAGAAILGSLLTARAQKRATTVQVEAAQASRENTLIDQLQEELGRYRTVTDHRATAQDERMTKLEDRNTELTRERDGYRDHAHELRSHIWDGKPPPPPDWPTGLPR